MKSFWLFRSNLRSLEDYHQYKTLKEFKNNCWDFYLLLPLWLLENDYFDQVIIWRLQPKQKQEDIIFEINGRQYVQRWINSFNEVYKYPKPNISFFRGGFREYCNVIKGNKKVFGKSLYLGAGQRVLPQYGGNYDINLFESEIELKKHKGIPFYKTSNPNIFKSFKNPNKKYDLCWPHNWTQIRYKGGEFFISKIANCPFLKSLKIVHCGNNPNVGRNLCKKYRVDNIEFVDRLSRPELNSLLNESRFGIVTSTLNDGCPRISTEIISSGTPLLIRNSTRLMNFYKNKGVVQFNDKNIISVINKAFVNYDNYSKEVLEVISNDLSFDEICKKNIDLWIN